MIGLDNPHNEIPVQLLKASGSFSWWYLDIIGENGSGVVVIWGYGLPFLPQRGDIPPHQSAAQKHPSLTISIYDQSGESFYLFQEFDEQDSEWIIEYEEQNEPQKKIKNHTSIPIQNTIQRWTFGDTVIVSTKCNDHVTLTLKLQQLSRSLIFSPSR